MTVLQRIGFVLIVFLCTDSCVTHDLSDVVDCDLSDLTVTLEEVDDATSCTTADGMIRVSATGGEPPYTFVLNGEPVAGEEFNNLPAGIYSILVQDKKGCDDTLNNVIVMAEDVLFTTTIEPDDECFSDNGSILVEVLEGNPPYTYKLGSGEFSEVNLFSQLAHGNHMITIKDNTDCTMVLNITVPRGQTDVTWASDIQPLLEANCINPNCHNGKDRINDFRKYADAKFYAKQIKTRTQEGSMPFDGSLEQSEIDAIACWVDDGALNN
ncbi:MAG TPA: SprB repeat-containing protein [Ohtaekwangia sp.]